MKKSVFLIAALLLFAVFVFNSCKKKEDPVVEESTTVTITEPVTTNTTWLASKTYVVNGEVYIDGCTLTIEPGTTIKFGTYGVLYIGFSGNTTVIAEGTSDKPILFTSSASSPVAGSWMGVYFYSHALSNTSLKYCTFKYGGQDNHAAVEISNTKIKMENCTISNAKTVGIRCTDAGFTAFNSNTINNCATHPIEINAHNLHTLGTGNIITAGTGFGILVNGHTVDNITTGGNSAITWRKQTAAFYFNSETDVDNLTLTIEPGCYFRFDAGASMWFGYSNNTTVIANGTSVDRITFTSSATNPAPGSWNGLYFHSHVLSGTSMSFCSVQHAGGSGNNTDANLNIENVPSGNFSIADCAINYSKGWGIIKASYQTIPASVTYTGNTLGNVRP